MSLPPGDQIYKQNADTRQECLHRTYSFALLLYHRSRMLSSKVYPMLSLTWGTLYLVKPQNRLYQRYVFYPIQQITIWSRCPSLLSISFVIVPACAAISSTIISESPSLPIRVATIPTWISGIAVTSTVI